MTKKKVAIIGIVGVPAKYGGFETLADYLIKNINSKFEFTVYCSKNNYETRPTVYNGAKLVYLPLNANGISSIFYDVISILHSLFYADTLLVLGVSGAFIFPFVRLFTNKKIITNIDGLEWKRDKWGKFAKKYLKWQEAIAVKYSHEVVVDNKGIEDHVLSSYKRKSNLVAYGGDHTFFKKLTEHTKVKHNIPSEYSFKVCRIEPENNIQLILEAFALAPSINLVIVGNWYANEYGMTLKNKYNKTSNIFLLDPIYDQEILNEIRSNCSLYIHGHSAGGTNPSLVEAMSLGLPIIAFDVNYNRYTMNNQGYFFDTKEKLVDVLQSVEKDNLKVAGNSLKKEASEKYTWAKISLRYSKLFE
jgi:glycosyltransferase involved in cell wall biosynthesis